MVMCSVPETETPIKTLNDAEATSTQPEGAIVIEVRLHGISSLRIVADESSTEERLRSALKTIYPLLELLHETVTSLECEPVGVRS